MASIEEELEKYPYLKDYKDIIYITDEEYDELKNGPVTYVMGDEISTIFLYKVLTDDIYFNMVKKFFKKEISNLQAAKIINGDTLGIYFNNKSLIIKGLRKLLKQKENDNPFMRQRYEELQGYISYEALKETYDGEEFSINIEGMPYNFDINNFFAILEMPKSEFTRICQDKEITNINGIPKEHYIYAIKTFFNRIELDEEYDIPDGVLIRFTNIKNESVLDTEAINSYLETIDKLPDVVELSEELRIHILAGIPEDLSTIEKAIYIYIKLCQTLSYNDEFFAVNQYGPLAKKHEDYNNISTITPENFRAVCFEFNLIYAKFLSELGIKFKSSYGIDGSEYAYGHGHANLEFRCGKFIIEADAVRNVLGGDMLKAKINVLIDGLVCQNKSKDTVREFNEIVAKMQTLILGQTTNTLEIKPKYPTFNELVEEYKSQADCMEVSIIDKLDIFYAHLSNIPLYSFDMYSYMIMIFHRLFNEEERAKYANIILIRDEITEQGLEATTSAIICINLAGFASEEETEYYLYNVSEGLVPINMSEIQERFNEQTYGYIGKKTPHIPGINGETRK